MSMSGKAIDYGGLQMSIRNLEFALKPRSVALIGASKRPGSVGAVLARNLFKGGIRRAHHARQSQVPGHRGGAHLSLH